jgi:hypothetical protein
MKSFRRFVCFVVFFFLIALPAAAQDAAALWKGVSDAAFDPAKSASVENLTLVRDHIRITLQSGTIQFTQPVAGRVFGAAFEGKGSLQVTPPDPLEAQQLERFAGQGNLNLTFSQATFCFSDSTFADVGKQVKWQAATSGDLANLYQKRQQSREDDGADVLARLFQAVLSKNPQHDAYFLADMKTDQAGWVEARDDAAELEDIEIGRWRSVGPLDVFDTWMEFPAGNRKPMAVDQHPLAKDDFLVSNYKIDATVTSRAKLSSTTAAAVQYRQAGERALVFHLDANLRVSSVKNGAGQSLAFFQPRAYGTGAHSYGDYLVVVLPQPTAAGGSATLTFQYDGKHVIRSVGSGNYFCPSYGWYPTRTDSFATRSIFTLTFHSPKKFILTATGEKTGEQKDKKEEVTEWKSSLPISVAGFAFGRYKEFDTKVGPTQVQVLANTNPDDFLSSVQQQLHSTLPGVDSNFAPSVGSLNPSATIKTMGTEISNSLRVFDNYFGAYPYTKLSVTNIPYSYGQGWPTLLYISALSFLDSTQRHVLGIQDQLRISDFFRAHETSHQWWGQEVGWKTYHDQWLSEGFAQFSGNLYVEFRENPRKYLDRIKQDKRELLEKNRYGHVYDSLGPVWMGQRLSSAVDPEGYSTVIYDKGGLILNMLRMMLSDVRSKDHDDRFKAMMHDYVQTYANKAASTEDFESIVDKHMTRVMDLDHNHKMDWFFRQYVYGTGVPDYTFTYQVSSAGNGRWRVNGTIVRSGVSATWKDILPLYIHLGKRLGRLGWIRCTQPKTTFSFTLPRKPDKLTLNDEEDILANIHQ